jgi:ABC-type sugar transport system ATPase subunit
MCDRIYLMSRGKIAGELEASEASQERIMELLV